VSDLRDDSAQTDADTDAAALEFGDSEDEYFILWNFLLQSFLIDQLTILIWSLQETQLSWN